MPDFVHLHTHSEYSLLDGLSSSESLAAQAASLGQSSLALTDHGVMYGAIAHYKACNAHGIKPIIGMEAYLTDGDRHAKGGTTYHLVLLAQNETGYHNLIQLATLAQLEGFYYKPRIDKAALEQYAAGLIALSGCVKGEIPQLLHKGDELKAFQALMWYKERLPFYLELQKHDLPQFDSVYARIIEWSSQYDVPLVATNDVHYAKAEQASAHDALLCLQTGKTLADTNRLKMPDHGFYLKSADEMAALFPASAIENTMAIAEQCNLEIKFAPPYHLPSFPVKEGDAKSYLRRLCQAGLKKRYGQISTEAQARLDYELGIINTMGFDDYFLIVWDITAYARRSDIWWNVRGSGAGSLVAYSLGITNIDPLKHKLMFERFLNPDRISMPDIDIDFPDDRREELIRYTAEKYGHVAQIITFGTLGTKAAIKGAGRVLGLPLSEVEKAAKVDKIEPDGSELLTLAAQLEGVASHASTHAAGVVISDRPITNYLPVTLGKDKKPMTQYPMENLDALGMLKVDFLGLKTLTQMRRCCELIQKRHGVSLNLLTIPYETDVALYELLSRGDTTGVFQVEGDGLRKVLRDMRPSEFRHIVAAVALYRPGPLEHIPTYIKRMHGEPVDYYDERLQEILQDTYAIMVFQEQIMQIMMTMGGYKAGEADQVRKAVSKKKREELEKHKTKFTEGALKNNYALETINRVWADVEFFARYGFNRAHATDYAMITCQTAYLKAHYPLEFMTALLTVHMGNTEETGNLLTEAKQAGMEILPPCVNSSDYDFTLEGDKIRIGLGAIKNVGEVGVIIAAAKPFANLGEFVQHCNPNKKALESLIKAGALDIFGDRGALMAGIDSLSKDAMKTGQDSLFDMTPQITLPKKFEPVSSAQKAAWENELLGCFLSAHPVAAFENSPDISGAIGGLSEGAGSTVGLIANRRNITTKKGEPMAFLTLTGSKGSLDVVAFPRTLAQYNDLLSVGNVVMVGGKIESRGDKLQLVADWVRSA